MQNTTLIQPAPLYQQVKAYVLDGIGSGRFRTGDKIPSESELCTALSASRLTVNRALRELSNSGVLNRVHGVGTFVAPPKVASTYIRVHNIADEIRSRNQSLSIRIHKLERIEQVASLSLTPEWGQLDSVFHSLIVYCADGIPVQLEDRYVSTSFAPLYLMQDFTKKSTTDYLQSIALPTRSEHEIQAMLPERREEELLDINGPEALLVITRKTWVKDAFTSFSRFIHPGSRQRFSGRATLDDGGVSATS
ncbi:UTRA domain-containing protein [Comamonas thiooxydans]|uniref:UTRA domain-containing protein n=1 Tax=Comamonas thiooxydans TaxID=363952 RepID=UPI0007C47CA8|nr:UTRA domain-containing protein [Comamonas thiooxydans]UBQ42004.1 UTRA domain-containing protein [Comamonas thiooxydans]